MSARSARKKPKMIVAAVNIVAVPQDDPVAYAVGFMDAANGRKPYSRGTAYMEGFKLGRHVCAGDMPWPTWAARISRG